MDRFVFVAAGAFVTAALGPASAHELIIKPTLISATVGSQLDFAVLSSHVLIASQEMEAPEGHTLLLVAFDGRRADVSVRPDEGSSSYRGQLKVSTEKPFFLTATRLPQIWATTPRGGMQATKQTPGASNAYKIDKFAKTLINAVPDGVGYDAVLGYIRLKLS